MFKTPLIKLASLGLFIAGAQASGGDGSCVTDANIHNSGASMNIALTSTFLSAVSGAMAQQGDGSEYGLISCDTAACAVIAETQSGMAVGRSSIGGESGNVGLTVYGNNGVGDPGLGTSEEINFHLVDDTGTLFDIELSTLIYYASNGVVPMNDASPQLVFNCQPAAGDSSSVGYVIGVTQQVGGAFDNLVNTGTLNSQMNLPIDGSETSNGGSDAFITDISVFASKYVNSLVGNLDTYKAGLGNDAAGVSADGAWSDSSNAQIFTINVVGTPTSQGGKPGPRWRRIVTSNNGAIYNGNWQDITEGENTINFGGVGFNRMVGFQIAGVVNIDSFTHNYETGTDSITVGLDAPADSGDNAAATLTLTVTVPDGTNLVQLHSDFFDWNPSDARGVASNNGDGTWSVTLDPAPDAGDNYKWMLDGVEENIKDDNDAGYCADENAAGLINDWGGGVNRLFPSGATVSDVAGECSDTPDTPVDIQGCKTATAFGFNPRATTDDGSCVTVGGPADTAPAGTAVFGSTGVNKNAPWGQETAYGEDEDSGVQVYNDFNYQGITFDALDVSGDASVHIDYNIHDLGEGSEVRLFLVSTSNGNEFGIALANDGSAWQSDDIALSAFADADAGVDLTQVDQIKLALTDSAGATQAGGAVAVANIVFKAPAPTVNVQFVTSGLCTGLNVDGVTGWRASTEAECENGATTFASLDAWDASYVGAADFSQGPYGCNGRSLVAGPRFNTWDHDWSECNDQGQGQYNGCFCVQDIVPGCMDEEANNYNPAATEDDGNCVVPSGGNAKRDKGKNKAKNKLIAVGLDGNLVDNIASATFTNGKRGIGSIMREIHAAAEGASDEHKKAHRQARKSVIRAALLEGNDVSFDLDDDANIPQSIKTELKGKDIEKVVAKQRKARDETQKAALLTAADGGATICGGGDVDVYIEDVPAGEMVEVVFELSLIHI